METESKRKLVKISIRLFVVVFVVLTAVWVWQYLHAGKIVISTDNEEDIISLERISENSKPEKISEGTGGELSARVPAGVYRISVGEKMVQATKTITLQARATESHKINPLETKGLDPVATVTADDFYASGSELLYLDFGGILRKMDSVSTASQVSNVIFSSVFWGKDGLGVGMDLQQNVYRIRGGSIDRLALPEEAKDSKAVNFTVSPENIIYVSVGVNIYSMVDSGEYKKFYTTSTATPSLVASKDKLAVVNPPQEGEGHSDKKEVPPFVEVVDTYGQQLAKEDMSAHSVGWAPDGSKLITVDYFGEDHILSPSLKSIVTLSEKDIQRFAWRDNDTLIYNSSGLLWSFTPKSGEAKLLSFVPAGTAIGDLAIDTLGKTVFVQTSANDIGVLRKLVFDGDEFSTLNTQQLPLYLPRAVSGCSIDYNNFSAPTILISSSPGIGFQDCETKTRAYLTESGITSGDLVFIQGPAIN